MNIHPKRKRRRETRNEIVNFISNVPVEKQFALDPKYKRKDNVM